MWPGMDDAITVLKQEFESAEGSFLPPQYYQDCLERLRELADWFFLGWHAYQEPHVWRDL